MSSGEEEAAGEEEEVEDWVEEYVRGMDHEIYRCRLSIRMENRYFSEVVKIIYKRLRAIVFAIEVKCNQRTIIRLNPADFLVNNIEENKIYVYSICPDPGTTELIETLDMDKQEIARYWEQKVKEEAKEDSESEEVQLVGEELQAMQEKLGHTVKVAGIKFANSRTDSGEILSDPEDEEGEMPVVDLNEAER